MAGKPKRSAAATTRAARQCNFMRPDLLAGGELTTGGGWCQGTRNLMACGHVLISLISPGEGVIYASPAQEKRCRVIHANRLFSALLLASTFFGPGVSVAGPDSYSKSNTKIPNIKASSPATGGA